MCFLLIALTSKGKNNSHEKKKKAFQVESWTLQNRGLIICAVQTLQGRKQINLQSYQISSRQFVGCSFAVFPGGGPCGRIDKHAPRDTDGCRRI